MKLNLNEQDLNKLRKLIDIKNENINLSDYFLDYIYSYAEPLDKEEIEGYIVQGSSPLEAYKKALINDLGLQELDVESRTYIENQAIETITRLNKKYYSSNPYYQRIKIKPTSFKNWKLRYEKYSPFELFIGNDLLLNNNFKETLRLSYFDEEFPFLAVIENNTIWMSVTPNEIDTMEKDINDAFGNVITFGLGLGYYPYMCSLKENVKSITIIEKDIKVIELFKSTILPLFEHKEKITIINEDAYKYLNNKEEMKKYDYCFFDIWHGAEDGIYHYLKFKDLIKDLNQIEFRFWLIDSIKAYLIRIYITLLEEYLEGYSDKDYTKAQNDYDTLVNNIYNKTKGKEFSSFDEITAFLKGL